MATALITPASDQLYPNLWLELWTSLASLLRSYTAAHGLNQKEQATVELGPDQIIVRAGTRWLQLDRDEDQLLWSREDLSHGRMRFTIEGRLSMQAVNVEQEEEMDLQAESWARELMQ
jgi:sarcosine oxidase gamma subunit